MGGDISIHALLAESDNVRPDTRQRDAISIHALLAESDYFSAVMRQNPGISIHALLAESDNGFAGVLFLIDISIHALLAESDWPPVRDIIQWEDFYPRSPCGERLGLDGRFKL